MPDLKARLPRRLTVGVKVGKDNKKTDKDERRTVQRFKVNNEDTYWGAASEAAESISRDLFADGSGRLVLASPKTRPTYRVTRPGPARAGR